MLRNVCFFFGVKPIDCCNAALPDEKRHSVSELRNSQQPITGVSNCFSMIVHDATLQILTPKI